MNFSKKSVGIDRQGVSTHKNIFLVQICCLLKDLEGSKVVKVNAIFDVKKISSKISCYNIKIRHFQAKLYKEKVVERPKFSK